MLPKLITGILIVPFTWFIVSAVLSISNILTASVIQLPTSTINKVSDDKVKEFFSKEKIIPIWMKLDLRGEKERKEDGTKTFETQDCKMGGCLSVSEFLSDANG